jgi:hypothetical protein
VTAFDKNHSVGGQKHESSEKGCDIEKSSEKNDSFGEKKDIYK